MREKMNENPALNYSLKLLNLHETYSHERQKARVVWRKQNKKARHVAVGLAEHPGNLL